MDSPKPIEPSSAPILSSQPVKETKPSPIPSSAKISPVPINASQDTGLNGAHVVLIVLGFSISFLILFCYIVQFYFYITGKPRPRFMSSRVAGDRGSAAGAGAGFGFGFGGDTCGGGGGGGCGGGGCGC